MDTCMDAVDTQHLWQRNAKPGQTCNPPNPQWYLSLLSALDASKGDLRCVELTAGNSLPHNIVKDDIVVLPSPAVRDSKMSFQ